MAFDLLILGCASATPTSTQYPTSQLLSMREQFFLIDCGEGTQQQMRRNKVKMSRIHYIFISHLHGDHYFGLVGLISSFHLLGRTKALNIFGPPALEEIIKIQLKASKTWLGFPLFFHSTQNKKNELIWEDEKVEIHSFPLDHRVPTTGFRFTEKPGLRKLIPEILRKHDVPNEDRRNVQLGKDWKSPDGRVIPNEELTGPPDPVLSYAYCSDTAYNEAVAESVRGVDLLYHEATFTEDHRALAAETKHSTAAEAAHIARMAGAKSLLMGHFSSRYANTDVHLLQAGKHFPNVLAATDNLRLQIHHSGIHVVEE